MKMEPDVCIESGSWIRVAVAGVGSMPLANLREYVRLITEHSRIDQNGMSSFYTEHQKSPFTQQPWRNGCLRFKFVVVGGGRASSRSQWEDFQPHRKFHGIIGLVHCPDSPDLDSAYERFVDACNDYPAAQTRRCFAFNSNDEQVLENDKKRPQLVILPPADNEEAIKHRLLTLMQEFGASILMAFESRVLLAETMGATLTTPMDSHFHLSSEEVSKAKRRRLERVQKAMGDYSLLAGSPADAVLHYTTALELTRSTGDSLWNAGAIEGSICALVVDPGGVQSDILVEDEVRYKYYEVIQLYRRSSAHMFEVEAELKLARFLCRKERGNELAREVSELLSGAVEVGRNLTDVNDQVVLFVEVARIYATVGYERKSAFFSRQVAQYYLVQDTPQAANSALQILLLAAKTYGIHNDKTSDAAAESQVTDGWNVLQINVLGSILAAATRTGDPLIAWAAGGRLLRSHYPFITPSSQNSLLAALKSASARLPSGVRCSDIALPFIRLLPLPPLPAQTEIIRKVPGKEDWLVESSSTGPFIYTPMKGSEASSRTGVTWVVGEPVEVVVAVANPCAFEVVVDAISLSITGVPFEAFPLSLTLPPSTSQVVSLSGVPGAPGSALVRGCFVEFTGVVTEHLFEVSEKQAADEVPLVDPFRGFDCKAAVAPSSGIVVTPPLPLLSACIVGGGDGDIVLYEGEVREVVIRLSNVGTVPVLEAHLTLSGKQRGHGIHFRSEVLKAALPLEPGSLVSIPVEIRAGNSSLESDSQRKSHPLMVFYYAGPESGEYPVGRQLTLPLQVHVRKGLSLVQARLLSLEVPSPSQGTKTQPPEIDPYRWSLRLLELELFNHAEVPFEMQVTLDGAESQEEVTVSRIDCNYSSRLLIPLEKLNLEQAKGGISVSSNIRLRWHWGRNCAGELQIANPIRSALRESLAEILTANPLTFTFQLNSNNNETKGDHRIHSQELIPIKMLVTNNTKAAMSLVLSIKCQDATNSSNNSDSVLWAGSSTGIEAEVPPGGKHAHSFTLCFLVPGEYTLVGAAAVESSFFTGPPFPVSVI